MYTPFISATVYTILWYLFGSWLGATFNVLQWSGLGIILFCLIIADIWSDAYEEVKDNRIDRDD